jgi:hypothetical protein
MARHSKSKYWIAASVLVLALITIIAAISFDSQSKKPKASEYLKVGHTRSTGTFYNQNRTVAIKTLGLNITAIMGDANNILIIVDSSDEPYSIGFLAKGCSELPAIQLKGYVTTINVTTGSFPLQLEIGCREATNEEIIIYLKPEDIVGI